MRRYLPLCILALVLASGVQQTATLAQVPDTRWGAAVGTYPAQIAPALDTAGIYFWYDYSSIGPDPPARRMALVRPWMPQGALLTAATAHPGGILLMGNEVNYASEDGAQGWMADPAQYAAWLWPLVLQIRARDPYVQFVGPQVLNWQAGAVGLRSGQDWSAAFLAAWAQQTGGLALPFMAWSLHTYTIPNGGNAQAQQADLLAARAWLNAHGLTALPLWLTEFGVSGTGDGLAEQFYMTDMLQFLTTQNVVSMWFPFALVSTDGMAGLVHVDGTLTAMGQRYVAGRTPTAAPFRFQTGARQVATGAAPPERRR